MKEQPLRIETNQDATIVVLTDEQKTRATKAFNDFRFAGGELLSRMQDGTLEEGYKQTLNSLLESYTVELNKQFSFLGKLAQEQEQRYADVRRLNTENRELRHQLGEKVSSEDVREKLKNLAESVSAWWRSAGTGHVSDGGFGSWGSFKGKLSGMLFNDENRAAMEGIGIRFTNERGHAHMIHCDGSIAGVLKMLTSRYPSAYIGSVEVFGGRNEEEYTVRGIEFVIDDLSEIA